MSQQSVSSITPRLKKDKIGTDSPSYKSMCILNIICTKPHHRWYSTNPTHTENTVSQWPPQCTHLAIIPLFGRNPCVRVCLLQWRTLHGMNRYTTRSRIAAWVTLHINHYTLVCTDTKLFFHKGCCCRIHVHGFLALYIIYTVWLVSLFPSSMLCSVNCKNGHFLLVWVHQ